MDDVRLPASDDGSRSRLLREGRCSMNWMSYGSIKGWCACTAYARVAFPLFRGVSKVNPLVVYYHIVSDREVPHVTNLYAFRSVSQFMRDMDVLLRFFRPLSLQDFLAHLEGAQELPRKSFLLTFDDGLKECYEVVAPILKRKGIPATFFLCSAFTDNQELAYDFKVSLLAGVLKGRSLSAAKEVQVRELLEGAGIHGADPMSALFSVGYRRRRILDQIAAVLEFDFVEYLKKVQPYLTSDQVHELLKLGHAVGAHSIDHPRYSDLPLEEQLHQTRESIRFVRQRFSLDYAAFAFPSSDANVNREFFREIFRAREVDVCFGNHGLLEDCVPRNVQRSSMEKTWMPAEAILGKSYARRCVRMATGGLKIRRT